jgi:septum formation protein
VELILASGSPRRRDLLAAAGYAFQAVSPDIEEIPEPGETPAGFVARAAREKAEAVAGRLPPSAGGRIFIGCDTVVTIDGAILGKPADARNAAVMLRQLSGRTHRVLSGLCLLRTSAAGERALQIRVVQTEVDFRELSANDIARYVATGEPMDKAGAYAIQGGAAHMVSSVRGSYTNVIGLPVSDLISLLTEPGPA